MSAYNNVSNSYRSSRRNAVQPEASDSAIAGQKSALDPPSGTDGTHTTEFVLNLQQRHRPKNQQDDSLNTNSSASPNILQPQSSLNVPCLSCLMRALQSSGLLNACWSAAFAELEEAFTIKRVADAMTAADGGSATARQHQQQQLENATTASGYRRPQTTVARQGLPETLEPTKWHALESLCALTTELSACQHRASGF